MFRPLSLTTPHAVSSRCCHPPTACTLPTRGAFAPTWRMRSLSCAATGSSSIGTSASEVHDNGNAEAGSTVITGKGQHMWTFRKGPQEPSSSGRTRRSQIKELPVGGIIRPLGRTRANDQSKVEALMHSIQEIGLQEPIDVLEVDGKYYGFSGCHRYEAHVRLGKEMILCRVRKANQEVLKMHLM